MPDLFFFTCAQCGRQTALVGCAPDRRLVCPSCLNLSRSGEVQPVVGPTETKERELERDDS